MVKWRNGAVGRIVKSSKCGMVALSNRGVEVVESSNGGVGEVVESSTRRKVELAELSNRRMVEWWI